MAKIRGASRFFRIGKEDIAMPYGTPAVGYTNSTSGAGGSTMNYFQTNEGNFSVKDAPTVEEQQVLQGSLGVAYREKTGTTVSGDVGVLTHPETVGYFLDAALLRDATDELHPHTIQEFYPGIDVTEKGTSYIGCKANQLSGSWGTGTPKAQLTASFQGQREEAFTGTIPPVVADLPTIAPGYFFTNSALIDLALTGVPALPVCDYTDINFTVANNLEEGPRCFSHTASLRGAISDLIAGQERLSGGFTLQWKDLTVLTRFRAFTDLLMRNIFIHPNANNTLVVSGIESAGPGVEIDLDSDPTGIIAANDVVAFQHGGATPTNWTTAKVISINDTAFDITVVDLDVDLAAGDIVWSEALELSFLNVNITDMDKAGGPEDAIVTVTGTIEGKATAGSGGQVRYRAKGVALPIA